MTAPQRRLTPAEYLAFEEAHERRHEYIAGQIYAMGGASTPHVVLRDNVLVTLHTRLRGGPCRPYGADLRVRTPDAEFYTYPDVTAVCGPPAFDAGNSATLLNPVLLVEVLSDSTEAYDRGEKFAWYQRIPSLREYVLVSQHDVRAECYARGADGRWTVAAAEGRDAVLPLASVGCDLPLAELYAGVDPVPRPRRLRRLREVPARPYAAGAAPA